MMKRFLLLVALLGTMIGKGFCQNDHNDDDRSDRVEAMKIAFITEKLALTPDEAKVFWPVFNEFTAEMKKIRDKEKEAALTFKAKTNPTEQEANKFIADHFASKQAQIDLTKKYSVEFKKVLPEQKVAKLLMLEQDFKQQLLQRLKNRPDKDRMQH